MSTVNLHDLLGAHGAPVTIDHDGKTYKLRPITQKVKDEVRDWLRRRALADAYRDKAFVPPDQYAEMVDGIRRDSLAGHLDFGGKVYMDTMLTPHGLAGLLGILCECSEEEAWALLMERTEETKLLLAEVVRSSLPRGVVAAMDRRAAEANSAPPTAEASEEAVPTSPPG